MSEVPSYAFNIFVYGGFDMVLKLRPGEGDIQNITCSCGWSLNCNSMTDAEAVEEAKEHGSHINYIKATALYTTRLLNYNETLSFLVMLGMDEQKAEDYLDRTQISDYI